MNDIVLKLSHTEVFDLLQAVESAYEALETLEGEITPAVRRYWKLHKKVDIALSAYRVSLQRATRLNRTKRA